MGPFLKCSDSPCRNWGECSMINPIASEYEKSVDGEIVMMLVIGYLGVDGYHIYSLYGALL